MEIQGFHLPGFKGRVVARKAGATTVLLPDLTPEEVSLSVERVMERGAEILPKFSTDDLASIFGQVAEYWQKPSEEKDRVVAAISDITGLSRPVVDRSITVEQGNSGTEDILAAMDRELGNHQCLDHFVDDPKLRGMTRAWGPKLVAAVLTANVPGLSYLPMVRSLMVKSPLAAKLSSGEPIFGPAWIKSLARIAPELAECIALFCWSGADADLEKPLFNDAPVVIVYGGPQSVPRLRETIGPHKKILEHGHKIGLAMVGKEMLSNPDAAKKLAEKFALDVAMFDQRACIAPQVLYVEKAGTVVTEDFSEMISNALAAIETELPASDMSLDTAATLAQERNLAAFDAAQAKGNNVFIAGRSTVVHEKKLGFDGVLPIRYLRVYPVNTLSEVLPIIEPHGQYLQNVGVAVNDDRLQGLSEELAKAGVSHITSIGLMHRPTMRWRHDGMAAFAEMVRWTDIEMVEHD